MAVSEVNGRSLTGHLTETGWIGFHVLTTEDKPRKDGTLILVSQLVPFGKAV